MALKRRIIDAIASKAMLAATLFSGFLVVGIAAALFLRSRPLLHHTHLKALLLGDRWLPSSGLFGFKPFIFGTMWVTVIAVVIATPFCVLAAIYMSEYANEKVRQAVKVLMDLLAGIPSVVFGVWGLLVVVPLVADVISPFAARHFKHIPYLFGESPTGFSVLSGGLVLAIMICPFIISIADEVLRSVPHELRETSFTLGATHIETIHRVVLRKALPGLIAAIVLGVSRALGETMAVLMVVGNTPLLPKTVFDPGYPLTALIANNYGEMMSIPLYDSALLGAALLLMGIVLFFNIIARLILVRAVQRAA